jgi:homoserine O-acetyltransferase/O-succinyltransferase
MFRYGTRKCRGAHSSSAATKSSCWGPGLACCSRGVVGEVIHLSCWLDAVTIWLRAAAAFADVALNALASISHFVDSHFRARLVWIPLLVAGLTPSLAAQQRTEADFTIRNFQFRNGEILPELKVHYVTLGVPQRDSGGHVSNAVLLLHGTGGSLNGFLSERYSVLFKPGQPLDSSRYYIVIPDSIGHGRSSKSSDGLRLRFPHYDYSDMVEAQYRLVTAGLRVDRLKLVSGISMGGMHAWMWGEEHPEMVDNLFPLVCMPMAITGVNRLWRDLAIYLITSDPEYQSGNYESEHGINQAISMFELLMDAASLVQPNASDRDVADTLFKIWMGEAGTKRDAGDLVYALDASRNYNPEPNLERIRARVFAINAEDDFINTTDQATMEALMKRVKRGRFVLLPETAGTHGHSSGGDPSLWKQYLAELMR